MVYAAVEAIDSKSCLTAELLVKNYISHDYGENLHFREKQQANHTQRSTANYSYTCKILHICINIFFLREQWVENCLIIGGHRPYFGRTFAEKWSNQKVIMKTVSEHKYEHWSARVVSFRDTQNTLKNQPCKWHGMSYIIKLLNHICMAYLNVCKCKL